MPASHLQTLRAMAYNNGWANHRLLSACGKLSQAEFEAGRTSFFPSIKATLNHILTIDRFYVDALEGGTLGPAAWADPEPCATVAELRVAQGAVDRRLIVWCEAMGGATRRKSSASIAARASSRSAPTGCCCTCSSTMCIIGARCMRC
jgi:uncharacterized damage-inducible protein DinB